MSTKKYRYDDLEQEGDDFDEYFGNPADPGQTAANNPLLTQVDGDMFANSRAQPPNPSTSAPKGYRSKQPGQIYVGGSDTPQPHEPMSQTPGHPQMSQRAESGVSQSKTVGHMNRRSNMLASESSPNQLLIEGEQEAVVRRINDARRKHNEQLEGAIRKQERELLQSAKLVQKLTEDRKKREESIFRRQKKYLGSLDQRMGLVEHKKQERSAEQQYHVSVISRKIREIEQKGRVRKEANVISDHVVKEILQSQPTDYFQQKYEVEVVRPELMRKQRIILERKKLYRPIRLDEIEQHEKLHEERLRILTEVKATMKEQERQGLVPLRYKSNYYEVIKKRERQKQVHFIKDMQKRKEMIERRKKYGEYVKHFVNVVDTDPEPDPEDQDEPEPVIYDSGSERRKGNLRKNTGLSNAKHSGDIHALKTVRQRKLLYGNLGADLVPLDNSDQPAQRAHQEHSPEHVGKQRRTEGKQRTNQSMPEAKRSEASSDAMRPWLMAGRLAE